MQAGYWCLRARRLMVPARVEPARPRHLPPPRAVTARHTPAREPIRIRSACQIQCTLWRADRAQAACSNRSLPSLVSVFSTEVRGEIQPSGALQVQRDEAHLHLLIRVGGIAARRRERAAARWI